MPTISFSVDEQTWQRATKIAGEHDLSLEKYLGHILQTISAPVPDVDQLSPLARHLAGVIPPMTDDEVERAIFDHRNEKYGEGLNLKFEPT